ncbi:MAG: hypothetical protein KatS3mg059_1159 [Thermomicrobiales bacterium]|nr:MAG: hypothetical protein KatS3mg059_1159 [Thermomicrobiales bacterium]
MARPGQRQGGEGDDKGKEGIGDAQASEINLKRMKGEEERADQSAGPMRQARDEGKEDDNGQGPDDRARAASGDEIALARHGAFHHVPNDIFGITPLENPGRVGVKIVALEEQAQASDIGADRWLAPDEVLVAPGRSGWMQEIRQVMRAVQPAGLIRVEGGRAHRGQVLPQADGEHPNHQEQREPPLAPASEPTGLLMTLKRAGPEHVHHEAVTQGHTRGDRKASPAGPSFERTPKTRTSIAWFAPECSKLGWCAIRRYWR